MQMRASDMHVDMIRLQRLELAVSGWMLWHSHEEWHVTLQVHVQNTDISLSLRIKRCMVLPVGTSN